MTGQVKEEMLSRFAELGWRVEDGAVTIDPSLLRRQEFLSQPGSFAYLDVDDDWQELPIPAGGLAFTWCQTPVVYKLGDAAQPHIVIRHRDGKTERVAGLHLPSAVSTSLFRRDGGVRRLTVTIRSSDLLTI